MISKEHKCIYIHIPKTAGTSIEKKLGHFETLTYNIQDHRTLQEVELISDRVLHLKKIAYAVKRGNFHRIAPNIKKTIAPEITKKQFDNFFKFSIVRNSWSRAYSWYNIVVKDSYHREIFDVGDIPFSFETFLKDKMDHHKFSQINYLKNKRGVISLDFIGRFENLQEDFNIVADHLGLKDAELPKLLFINYDHYTTHYTPATKDLIYKLYKEEIDYFGFEYGE